MYDEVSLPLLLATVLSRENFLSTFLCISSSDTLRMQASVYAHFFLKSLQIPGMPGLLCLTFSYVMHLGDGSDLYYATQHSVI